MRKILAALRKSHKRDIRTPLKGSSVIIQGPASLPHRVVECQVEVSGSEIHTVVTDSSMFRTPDVKLQPRHLLCPGFLDPQINGGFGKEFKTDGDAIEHVTRAIPQYGVTGILPTVTTKELSSYPNHLRDLSEHYSGPGEHARVLGIHLEGPALNPKKRGAHPEEWLRSPDEIDLDELLSPMVRVVTVAPELPDGWKLAHQVTERGLRVGLGHSTAEYDDVVSNFEPQLMHIVHTYNAMSELTSRSPGLVGVALDRPDFYASVIADLVHVHPASLRVLWKARNRGARLFGVSDGSAVLGLPLGHHQIGTREIERRDDRAVLKGTETLVGSVLTMNVAARNILSVTECEVWEAVNFVSLNPATYLGLSDSLGSIESGKLADLCIVDENFDVHFTMIDGIVAFGALR